MQEIDRRRNEMKTIRDELVAFSDSPLYEYRTKNKYHPVVGEGSHLAKIMFVGEAPGRNEAETGRPFCGQSGRLLDELLKGISLERSDVYITNIVKDRPPENRDPLPNEIALYGPFLDRQIDIIRPQVIATLGRFSMVYILQKFNYPNIQSITSMHGKPVLVNAPFGELTVVPLYHPAAAIYNQKLKDTLKADFEVLKQFLA